MCWWTIHCWRQCLRAATCKNELCKRLKMKNLGEAAEFWVNEILVVVQRILHICQKPDTSVKYLNTLAWETRNPVLLLWKYHPLSSPLESLLIRLFKHHTVGWLIWLMVCTHPDIGYAVGTLSQHCETPLTSDWIAFKSVLRYIKCTRTIGLKFGSDKSAHLKVFCDSEWASCRLTRRPTDGYVFLILGGAVSYKSEK